MKYFKSGLTVLTAYAFATANLSAQSSVYSSTVVGYIDLNISAGNNLIANQLGAQAGSNNDLNDVLTNGVATGSTFSEWEPTMNQLMPLSVFNGTAWSINYNFGPDGTGGVLNSPSATTVFTVGDVLNLNIDNGVSPFYTFVPPTRGPGTYLLSLAAPIPGTFDDIIGRAPNAGDLVITLDGPSQTYSTNTFDGTSWSNGDPSLAVDQSAYFTLVPAPEPSVLALCGLGAAFLGIARRRKLAVRG